MKVPDGMTVERVETYSSFSGPLPHPSTLEQYERACPGAADRIIAMAERQSAHRHELENTVVSGNVKAMHRAQVGAVFLAALGMALGAWLVDGGNDIGGYVTLIGSLGTLLYVYISGKRQQENEVGEKRAREIAQQDNES